MIEVEDLYLFMESNFQHLDMVFVRHCKLTDSTVYLLEFDFGFFKIGRYEIVESIVDEWFYEAKKQATLFNSSRSLQQSEIDRIWDQLQKEFIPTIM